MTVSTKREYVKTTAELVAAVNSFTCGVSSADPTDVKKLAGGTKLWVFHESAGTFAPNKFAGIKGGDFDRYVAAKKDERKAGSGNLPDFHGSGARRRIEKLLRPYQFDSALNEKLDDWLVATCGYQATSDIKARWKFVTIKH